MTSDEIEPDVSVVIPAWGDYAGRRLEEALDSLRSQDCAARLIVVDNASDPPLAHRADAEVVRSETRLTVGAARNLGLARVETPYVVFWDADDLMLPGTIRFLRDRIARDSGVLLVAAGILEGDPPEPHRWPRRWTYPLAARTTAFAFADSIWSLFPTTGATIIRTAATREAGGFADANSGEDWALGVSLGFRGRVVLEARPGRLYRRHSASLWETQRSARQLRRHSRAVRARMRRDPAVPGWAKSLLPAVAVMQLAAIYGARPAVETARVVRRGKRSVE